MAPFRKLAGALRTAGIAQVVCAAFLVVLGFMGFETTSKINSSLLLIAAVLLFTGGGSLTSGRAFGQAVAGGGNKLALVEGVRRLAGGYAIVAAFFVLAAIVFGARLAMFVVQVAGREGG